MTRIAVLDDWQDAARTSADWSPLQARAEVKFHRAPFPSEDAAARALADFDVVLATRERTPFPRSLWTRLPKLRMFSLTGARAALIDIEGMSAHGITVCHTGGGPSLQSTAELALGLLLAAARRIAQGDASVRSGRFQLDTPRGFMLGGKTLGIMGLGRIGAQMATYCKALGMRVVAWSQNLTEERASAVGATRVSKDELLSTSDAISLHLVLSDRTRRVIDAAALAHMKPGAILVNTSRAGLIDEHALIESVESGHVIAALDVYWQEPLPAYHPLARASNCLLTPHLGYSADEVYAEYYPQSVENALAFLEGKPIRVLQKSAH